jgi:hypothetical protein
VRAVLQIQSPGFQAAQIGSYRTRDKNANPLTLPNCITAPSSSAKRWQPYLETIRRRIARGAWTDNYRAPKPAQPTGDPTPDLAGQLVQLAELQLAGALTAEEFDQAKKRLLSGG